MQIVNEILDPQVPFFSWGFAFSIGRQNWKDIYRKIELEGYISEDELEDMSEDGCSKRKI